MEANSVNGTHNGGKVSAQPQLVTPPRVFVRDLEDGQPIDGVYLVSERETRRRKSGEDYLRLTLADSSGSVPAMVWDEVEQLAPLAEPGAVVHVTGKHEVHSRYGPQVTVRALRPAEPGEYDDEDLRHSASRPAAQLESELRELVATIQRPELRALLERTFAPEGDLWQRFSEAPAAKHYHQAYRHGLLEHSLTVAQGVNAASGVFGGVDRDVAVTGALLHDVGKTEAYGGEPGAYDLTDAGKLQGEITLGYAIVRRELEDLGVEPALAQAVLHIVLSHHGSLEHGSPVVPATREATLVHMIDNLGGRLGSFDRLERGLPEGESWSSWDRALSGSAYFADRAAA